MNESVVLSINDDIWLEEAERCPSPNYNDRPQARVDLLVIHNISLPPNQFGGRFVHDFFLNQLNVGYHPYFETIVDVKVSAHFFIDRKGAITQFVPLNKRAWHAGVSCFRGEDNCNDFSLGVELEGADDIPYTDEQYATLSKLTKQLQQLFPAITNDRIAGHATIAPERKTDPGPAFDWQHYRQLLAKK
jgi:AmpD protein